jgi:ATP-dependent protease HslVU (ClpYQ) peptidase subunit
MTIIVAARGKKGVIVAADSQTTNGWEKMQLDRTKLWVSGTYVFGAAGCVRTAQVIKHCATWPKYRPDEDADLEAFAVKSLVPAIREAVQGTGTMQSKSGVESTDTELLIAWGNHLLTISGNGAVCVPKAGRLAIGSGYAEALGYLGNDGPWTVEQVCEAARRATISAHGCDGPISYVTTKGLRVTTAGEA